MSYITRLISGYFDAAVAVDWKSFEKESVHLRSLDGELVAEDVHLRLTPERGSFVADAEIHTPGFWTAAGNRATR